MESNVPPPPKRLQLSYCCAHHGTFEVGAMTWQTVKVHFRVLSLHGWPGIYFYFFPWNDLEPELYSVPALCLVAIELVLLVGLWLPNVCSSVKGPWWFSHDNLSSPWSISQDKGTLVPRVSFKGCLWLYIELYTHTLRGDSDTNITHSDQNMLVFIFLLPNSSLSCHLIFLELNFSSLCERFLMS